ncbi:MAG: EAL domain-containing protein [Alphaproteobacteria bacterium]|nr:EAL domain-containing protein [Alphaproteobacteria bacterium]MCB9985679.1 EAL domain-containing protein [Micavibrio sp.]HPQ50467.1 EAL domain-containing protein [Alphaproteobacteria bacterium]HRK97692.1 EAL domain-containing protein [Alphaproteobacteria bacterium]
MRSDAQTQYSSVPRADKLGRKSGLFTRKNTSSKTSTSMWRSRLSWKIVMAVFLTIMTVQATLMVLTLKSYQQEQLFDLKEDARRTLVTVASDKVIDRLSPPYTVSQMNRLVSFTSISGLAVYSIDFQLLGIGGENAVTTLFSESDLSKTFLSNDQRNYEVVFRPKDIDGLPYFIVARLDASKAASNVAFYVRQNILIMFLMSALVTTVLMIAIGKWLLEPILFLRDNVSLAIANPEAPNIEVSPYDDKDEVGGTISATQELIRQNAKNIRQVKSAAQSQIHKLAYYDTLTGLPNRTLFIQKLSEHVKLAAENQKEMTRLAIVAFDLDHFKDINDSMGHNVGDAILSAVGKRLRSSLPESAVVARSGEDEFAVTFPLTIGSITAKDVGDKVRSIITHEPFRVFNETFQVRASIGVATFPDDALDPDQVLKNADIALNRAKEEGRDCIREYLEDFDKAVQARFQMLRDLRNALENKDLTLYFQPQLDLKSGQVIGAEALIRWFKKDNSKEGGKFISPVEFIPIAEQSGLIVPIGEWVMRHACLEAKKWHDKGNMIRIAVNVSGEQFQQSDIVAHTRKVIEETGINPHLLELEVTESAFMEDIQQTVRTLKELHALGVELAIDDFGTGYSSLSYLRQFPIDRLKIDQSFIRNALNNPDDAAIARTIIGLGRSLNLKIIAEGVETKEHETFLINEGCDEVQGYRYSRPIPDYQMMEFIRLYTGRLDYFE